MDVVFKITITKCLEKIWDRNEPSCDGVGTGCVLNYIGVMCSASRHCQVKLEQAAEELEGCVSFFLFFFF